MTAPDTPPIIPVEKIRSALNSYRVLAWMTGIWLIALVYECRGAQRSDVRDRELLVAVRGSWAAVSLRVDSGPSDEPDYPLYLVRLTEEGPRIVVDGGLRLPTNKGRKILNDRVWEHLDGQLGEAELGLVRKLFEGHVARSQADYDAWEKNTKSSP